MSSSRRLRRIAAVLLPAAAVMLVSLLGSILDTYRQYTLTLGVNAALVGVALVVIVGYARIITLATGSMLAIGAYCAALLVERAGVPFVFGIVGAMFAGVIAGLALAFPASRFRGHHLAMATLVFQMVVIILIREATPLTGGAGGLRVPDVHFIGIPLAGDTAYLIFNGAACAIMVAILTVLLRGHFGKALRACSLSEVGATAYGIRTRDYHVLAFTISSAAIAYAGAVLGPRLRILDPESFGFLSSAIALAYPIVGGMTSAWGGLLGGGALRLAPEFLRGVQEYQELIYALLVILALRFLPGGVVDVIAHKFGRASSSVAPGPSETSVRHPQAPATTVTPLRQAGDAEPALMVEHLTKSYGALVAVRDVSLRFDRGAIHGIIGPNGAGKTTLFNAISGFIEADTGAIRLFGTDVTGQLPHTRIGRGITRTFQNLAVFGQLSCLDNVVLGLGQNAALRSLPESFGDVAGTRAARERVNRAFAALEAVGIADLAPMRAGALSLGNQRRLEVARAIVSEPKLILFDEPVSGVSEDEEGQISELLLRLNRQLGVTMLVIEHNIGFVRRLTNHLVVMANGAVIAQGAPEDVLGQKEVRSVYFGESGAAA